LLTVKLTHMQGWNTTQTNTFTKTTDKECSITWLYTYKLILVWLKKKEYVSLNKILLLIIIIIVMIIIIIIKKLSSVTLY